MSETRSDGRAESALAGFGALTSYLALSARRDRMMLLGLLAFCLCAAAGMFVGGSAMAEKREASAVFSSAAARLTLIASLVFFAVTSLRRRIESCELDLLASLPFSRAHILLAHLVLLAAMAAIGAAMATTVAALTGAQLNGLPIWGAGVFLEAASMAAAALFVAAVIESPTAAIVICMGWYALGRMIGVFLGIASAQEAGGALHAATAWIMDAIALLMPRFDLVAQSGWLAHGIGDPGRAALDLAGLAIYPVLLAAAALFDFRRRTF